MKAPTCRERASAKAFAEGLRRLKLYRRRTGHAHPPARQVEPDGYRLGNWVWLRRAMRRKGQLTPKQIQALEALPGWEWAPRDDRFLAPLGALRAFAEREGHTYVPEKHHEQGFALGCWVASLRSAISAGHLSPTKQKLLSTVPHWSPMGRPVAVSPEEWKRRIASLKRFVREHGHLHPPTSYRDDAGVALGPWMARLRQERTAGRLSAEEVAALEGVPQWSWDTYGARWAHGFEALRAFIRREGHVSVPSDHVENGRLLVAWVNLQRRRYWTGELQEERLRALEALPEWSWRPSETTWARAIGALRQFVAREGHALVPVRHREGEFALGVWVQSLRKSRRLGILARERAQELESVQGWSWGRRYRGAAASFSNPGKPRPGAAFRGTQARFSTEAVD